MDMERFSVGSTEQIRMKRNGDSGVEEHFLVIPVTAVRWSCRATLNQWRVWEYSFHQYAPRRRSQSNDKTTVSEPMVQTKSIINTNHNRSLTSKFHYVAKNYECEYGPHSHHSEITVFQQSLSYYQLDTKLSIHNSTLSYHNQWYH